MIQTRAQAVELEARAARGDEDAARELLAAAGITEARVGQEEYAIALREALSGPTPTTDGAALRLTDSLPPAPKAEPLPEPEREYTCAYCGDREWVSVTRDRAHPMFGRSVPCRECVPLETRMERMGVPALFLGARLDALIKLPGKAEALAWCAAWDGTSSVRSEERRVGKECRL